MKKKTIANNYLNYSGKVQIDIFDGDRKLSSAVHNSGRQPLFQFIADCLLGNFTAAKDNYPSKIACFAEKEGLDAHNNKIYEKVSSYVHYDSAKYLTTNDDVTSINFHFRVPYTCMVNGKKIKKIALFTNSGYSDNDKCAEIDLDNEIQIPESGGNFTVIVNWIITIADIATTSTNKEN